MAIICAVYDAETSKTWLGCNSGSLTGDTIMPEHGTKWLRFTSWAIAFAGTGIARDLLEIERPKFPNQTTDIGQVASFIRTAFAKHEFGTIDDGARAYSITGLIAHSEGALYSLDRRLAISKIPDGAMWACGSGMAYALGADSGLKIKGFNTQERIETAVLAAIDLDSGCPGEPIVESLG